MINGERWLWRYSPLKGNADGWTEYGKHKVLINSRLSGRRRLTVEIHESLHSAFGPTLSEEAVTQAAEDMARIMWSLGYRLPKDDKQ